ncbi:MAG TPA: peptide MFS transporter [Stellaceae bacterium]|nr:peptide MFS transporter [Stellaceae bacterium]
MTSTPLGQPVAAPRRERPGTFLGQPRALAYLAFTEAWERFSFYGMAGLLVLYMSQSLLLPGHIEHIAGFAAFRAGLEAVFGKLSTLGLASQIYGLYTGLVYFTPVFGGWVADRWIGRRNAVMLGAVLMSAGHIAMAFDASFLAAVALLITGCGLLKGNISAQVGGLYAETDGEGRTRGFAIFSIAINVGAFFGPLICGLLADLYGWHAGFGLAGVLMLCGLATYVAGYRHLPDAARGVPSEMGREPLGPREWRIIAALVLVMAVTMFQSVAYYQNSNISLVWIDQGVDLQVLGRRIPVPWFNSIDPLASIVFVPPLFALWRWQAVRGGEPGEIGKIAIGAAIAAAANLLLVVGCLLTDRVPALVPVVYDILLGIAFLYYWPTLLALVSRAAPHGLKATLMGVAFLSLFVSNIAIGWLGGFYESMTPTGFWTLHAAIAATGAVLALAIRRPMERLLLAR